MFITLNSEMFYKIAPKFIFPETTNITSHYLTNDEILLVPELKLAICKMEQNTNDITIINFISPEWKHYDSIVQLVEKYKSNVEMSPLNNIKNINIDITEYDLKYIDKCTNELIQIMHCKEKHMYKLYFINKY